MRTYEIAPKDAVQAVHSRVWLEPEPIVVPLHANQENPGRDYEAELGNGLNLRVQERLLDKPLDSKLGIEPRVWSRNAFNQRSFKTTPSVSVTWEQNAWNQIHR